MCFIEVKQCTKNQIFTVLLNAVYPMHRKGFAHAFPAEDPMVQTELISHVPLGYRPNNINQVVVSNHANRDRQT